MATVKRNWRLPFPDKNLGTKFGVKDAAHPNGHRGTDWNGFKSGTPLPACVDATFVKSFKSSFLGNVAVFQVGSRFISYCHMLQPSKIKVGAKVKAGDTIGLAGTTGTASSDVHLHAVLGDTIDSAVSGQVYDLHSFLVSKIAEEKKVA